MLEIYGNGFLLKAPGTDIILADGITGVSSRVASKATDGVGTKATGITEDTFTNTKIRDGIVSTTTPGITTDIEFQLTQKSLRIRSADKYTSLQEKEFLGL